MKGYILGIFGIDYIVFHCAADKAVNIEEHSARFVEAMKVNHKIKFHIVPLRGHCDLSPEAKLDYKKSILKCFE